MVGAFRRPAQSRVGASKTISTSRVPTSRSTRARSAEPTSWITGPVSEGASSGGSRRGPDGEAAAAARSGTFCPGRGRWRVEGRRAEASRSYPADMADPLLRLDATSVTVQPGGQAQVGVTVTSASDIVEGYSLSVVGAQPSQWAEVVPPTVNVYPGAEATAVVVFSPPSGTGAASGRFPFGVKAASTESADASSVVEGTVELGAVSGLQAKIVPVTSSGR